MKIGIIGAGLAGLTCAWYLKKNGIDNIVIFESSDRAGGKLKTDTLEGYQLDRGFQVLLPAYPETKRILDYEKLQLQKFAKGSLIYKKERIIPFYDLENGLIPILKTAIFGPGSLLDKLKIFILKLRISFIKVDDIFKRSSQLSSIGYLRQLRFSYKMIEEFWKPFYQGVFLENNLDTDSKMLQFTFKMFSEAGAAVPKAGMEAIPKQMVEYIGKDKIKTNSMVINYTKNSITLENEVTERFDHVILACANTENVIYNVVTNMYFEAEKLPVNTKHVILNANNNRVVNNVVLLSNVAPSYSNGKQLISVSANGIHQNESSFLMDLRKMFGEQVLKWRHLKTYVIKDALPIINYQIPYNPKSPDGVYRCGDYLLQASINGAMQSGRLVAEAILKTK